MKAMPIKRQVFALRHYLQMCRVNAPLDLAYVVKNLAFRNHADE